MTVRLFLDYDIRHESHVLVFINVTNVHSIHHEDLFLKLPMTGITGQGDQPPWRRPQNTFCANRVG